jgi:hypothetical protein
MFYEFYGSTHYVLTSLVSPRRAIQAKLMPVADRVLVWLGESADGSEHYWRALTNTSTNVSGSKTGMSCIIIMSTLQQSSKLEGCCSKTLLEPDLDHSRVVPSERSSVSLWCLPDKWRTI